MMRVSRWHKDCGDHVEIYDAWKGWRWYDKIYVFSLFDFTEKRDTPPNAICGGTGFSLETMLSPEIDISQYDWDLYPACDYSLIWFSRGCIRNCPFCVVRQKEGGIHPVEPKNLNPNGKYIKVMDNNFFANPRWREAIEVLFYWGQPCDFQGVDARILTLEMCNALILLKHHKQIHIAWDNPRESMVPKFREIIETIKPYRLMCYVLIGYWSTEAEDIMRVEALRELKIDPFVMPYCRTDPYQKGLARYVNMKAEFKSQTWDEYKKRKGVPNGPGTIQ